MKQKIVFLFAAIALTFQTVAATDEAKVRQVFQKYRQALINSDGASAWDVIDSETRDYYTQAAKEALTLSRDEFKKRDLITQFIIARTRHEFTYEQLKSMDGKKLFEIGVDRSWISRSSVETLNRMKTVKITGSKATGTVASVPRVPILHFTRENGKWLCNLTNTTKQGNVALEQVAKQRNLTDGEFIKLMLASVSEKKVSDKIFDPPTK